MAMLRWPLTLLIMLAALGGWRPPVALTAELGDQAYQAEIRVVAPTPGPAVRPSPSPPVLTDAQRARLERLRERVRPSAPPLPEGPEVMARTAVIPVEAGRALAPRASSPDELSPFDIVVLGTGLGAVPPADVKSTTSEPTADGYGNIVVYSANWFLALSGNGGASFSYISSFDLMAGVDGGFCCDQVVLYDPSRDLLFILLQSIDSAVTQRNTHRLFVARGIAAGNVAIYFYDFTPQMFGFPAGEWFDFPSLTTGANSLYITANNFAGAGTDTNPFVRSFIARLNLDELRAAVGLNIAFFHTDQVGTLRVADGITTAAYFASHLNTTTIRIFFWPEGSTSLGSADRVVPATSNATGVCPGPDGRDWCGFLDRRILATFLSGGQLGFGWTSGQEPESGRPFPYVRLEVFAEAGLTLLGSFDFFDPSFAVAYPAAAPNARGGLGFSVFIGGGALFPTHVACLNDDVGFQCVATAASTNGPDRNRWGDYLAVRRSWPGGNTFHMTGFVLQGGPVGANVQPLYLRVGRARDF